MNVRQLLQKLERVYPDLEVVITGGYDHSYIQTTHASVLPVEFHARQKLYQEYFDSANMSGGVLVDAFVISTD